MGKTRLLAEARAGAAERGLRRPVRARRRDRARLRVRDRPAAVRADARDRAAPASATSCSPARPRSPAPLFTGAAALEQPEAARRVVLDPARALLARGERGAPPPDGARDRRPPLGRRAVAALARLPRPQARGAAAARAGGTRPPEQATEPELLTELLADPGTSVVRPGALGTASVAHMVEQTLGAAPEPAFARACLAATGGNPLFLDSLLATLAAQGVRPVAAEAARVEEVGPEPVGPRRRAAALAAARRGERPRAGRGGARRRRPGRRRGGARGARPRRRGARRRRARPRRRAAARAAARLRPPGRPGRGLRAGAAAGAGASSTGARRRARRPGGASPSRSRRTAALDARRRPVRRRDAARRGAPRARPRRPRRRRALSPPRARRAADAAAARRPRSSSSATRTAASTSPRPSRYFEEAIEHLDDPVRRGEVALELGRNLRWTERGEEAVRVFEEAIERLGDADARAPPDDRVGALQLGGPESRVQRGRSGADGARRRGRARRLRPRRDGGDAALLRRPPRRGPRPLRLARRPRAPADARPRGALDRARLGDRRADHGRARRRRRPLPRPRRRGRAPRAARR